MLFSGNKVDDNGSPLISSINESTEHESEIGYLDIQKLAKNKTLMDIYIY